MLRENSTLLTSIHKTLDLFLVLLAFGLAYQLKKDFVLTSMRGLSSQPNYVLVLLIAVCFSLLFFRINGFYTSSRRKNFAQISRQILKAVMGSLAATIITLYLIHEQGVSRLLLLLFSGILTLLLFLTQGSVYYLLRYYRSKQYNTRNVLIIGTKGRAKRLVTAIERHQSSGYRIMGCLEALDTRVEAGAMLTDRVKILGNMQLFSSLLLQEVVDAVVFAVDLGIIPRINEHIQFAEELGVRIHIMPDFQIEKILYQPATASVFLDDFVGLPSITLSSTPQQHTELLIKSMMDYCGAALLLLLLLPLFLLLALLIKVSSPGPVFFQQQRCGLSGRTFNLIKFRTMVHHAEELKSSLEGNNEMDGPVFKIKNDPRITRLGRLLRRTSIDELPQLFNVLRGQMSLVGPRPPLPSEVALYKPWQRRRLSMKPGLTCIWQVSGRNSIGFERWMRMDLEYIDNWSLFLDLKILLKTVKEVLACHGN